MSKITGAELLARSLVERGVAFHFGIVCPENVLLLDSLIKLGVPHISVCHEQAAVHMAQGVYRATGKLACVSSATGPGVANMLPGIVAAYNECEPVIVLTCQRQLDLCYPDTPAVFQSRDQLRLLAPAVKWGGPIFMPHRIPEVVDMAVRHALNGSPGPVQIEMPITSLSAEIDEDSVTIQPSAKTRVGVLAPSQRDLEAAADLLANARLPFVIAGWGVEAADAQQPLLELVELLNCPVSTTYTSRSAVPSDHPNFVFGFSDVGDMTKQASDVVLVCGSRLGNPDVPSDARWGSPDHHALIQIDIEPTHFGVSRPVDVAVLADARLALEGLVDVLKERQARGELHPVSADDLSRHTDASRDFLAAEAKAIATWSGSGIHPASSIAAVKEVFGPEATYALDGGQTKLWARTVLPPVHSRGMMGPAEYGMLGQSTPMAIGAKLADPSRDVVCITGDGAAGFHFLEMQTAVHENVKITSVVHAEGYWSMEIPATRSMLPEGRLVGVELGEVRWDTVAKGLGCHAEYVDRLEDLVPALERAKAAEVASVVCVKTDMEANIAVAPETFARFGESYVRPLGDSTRGAC